MTIQVPSRVRAMRLDDIPSIRAIMEASLATDAIPGFEASDIDRAITRLPADPEGCLVAEENGVVVGYCIPRFDDLTVHPDYRRRGHGGRLVEAARRLVGERGLPYLQLHGPRNHPATQAFVAATGARYHSSLWLFELTDDDGSPAAFPPGFTLRTLGPDEDLASFVDLMNQTFADHPTPLSWTLESVRIVHDQPDFDPDGVLLVSPADDVRRSIAFTKVEFTPAADDAPAKGWIALIGVLPPWRGLGLGRALLAWGVRYLRSRGAVEITLSAEALNERATTIYRRAGFVPTIEWPHYVLDPA